jgi:Na+-transporting methylmalonyl-CoA/oxaloacetate decarboxylase gamma subunit
MVRERIVLVVAVRAGVLGTAGVPSTAFDVETAVSQEVSAASARHSNRSRLSVVTAVSLPVHRVEVSRSNSPAAACPRST